jgi:hypothetical protein
VTRPRFDALTADGLIWFGSAGNNVPRRKVFREEAQGLVPSTWWTHAEVGHNADIALAQGIAPSAASPRCPRDQ